MARREGSFNDAIHRRPSPTDAPGCVDESLINPVDAGVYTAYAGIYTADAGIYTADAGIYTADAGVYTADAGIYTADAGI